MVLSDNKEHKVHVSLPKDATYRDLASAFQGVAKLHKIEVPRNAKNPAEHRGFAYVTFKDEDGFNSALKASLAIGAKPLTISVPKKGSDAGSDKNIARTVLKTKVNPKLEVKLANVNHKTKLTTVIATMKEFGDLLSVVLPLRRNARDNIGRGKVIYEHEVSAAAALEAGVVVIDETEVKVWRKKSVDAKPAADESPEDKEESAGSAVLKPKAPKAVLGLRQLFVGNLKFDWTEANVRHYFKTFGPIENFDMPVNKEFGLNLGYANITYVNKDTAANVMRQTEHFIKKWQVDVVGRQDYLNADLEKERMDIKSKVEKRRESRKRKREQAEIAKESRRRAKIARTGQFVEDEFEDVVCAGDIEENEEAEAPELVAEVPAVESSGDEVEEEAPVVESSDDDIEEEKNLKPKVKKSLSKKVATKKSRSSKGGKSPKGNKGKRSKKGSK